MTAGLSGATLTASARRLAPLAWPVFVGQISVVAFSTIDTALLARYGAADLAALAVGSAAYITVFIGFMGVVLALGPIAGRLFGARRSAAAGRQVHQALWIALALALVGDLLLAFPAPFLWLSKASPEVEPKVRGYLLALAFSLPASLVFTVFRSFNTAVSRPKASMAVQVGGLVLKVPLSTLLVFGWPALGVPAQGVVGCGIATAVVMWTQALIAWYIVQRDPFYRPFEITSRGLDRPDRAAILSQLRLGLPMGASILIEVTGFAFMAIFIARLGTTTVAGHQIAANFASLMFMVPLAVSSATGALVAQRIGARDEADAMRLGWHGVAIAAAISGTLGLAAFFLRRPIVALYASDAAVIAAAVPLLAWVALFHLADAVQAVAAAVLRAWHIATLPLVINALAIWGFGLFGGYALAFDLPGFVPRAVQGAPGFWLAASASLAIVAGAFLGLLAWLERIRRRESGQAER